MRLRSQFVSLRFDSVCAPFAFGLLPIGFLFSFRLCPSDLNHEFSPAAGAHRW